MQGKISQKSLKKKMLTLLAGILITSCLANHLFSIFDKKALQIILVFLFFSPLLGWGFSYFSTKLESTLQQIPNKQVLFCISSLGLGFLAAILCFHAPVSYQTLSLQPQISNGQYVELLEIKAAGDILSINDQAGESKWSTNDGVFTAASNSQPLTVTFLAPVNSKVNILFNGSSQGGKVLLSLGKDKKEINLLSQTSQQELITFHCSYRNIPGWLFLPFLILSDVFTFSLVFLMLFLFQERGQSHLEGETEEKFPSKKSCIIILFVLACILHFLNALTVPLIVDSDSPAYLQGAVYLLKYGNLEGISAVYAPGTTFLFAPVLYLFGRNPWGMKLLLHSIAVACVLISYHIGWKLSKKRWLAFCSGLITLLIPDLYYYSNFIMSDLPNIFLILLFTSLLLDTLDDFCFSRILITLIAAGLATILRTENILLLLIGVFFLGFPPFLNWLQGVFKKNNTQRQTNLHALGTLCLALLVALIPILGLSFFNYEVHGFFGLNNSSGMVLYDGWVYYPEASRFDILDENSAAVQEIKYWTNEYPINITDSSGVATAGEIYPSLIKAGFSTQEAFDLIGKAAWDSILSHKEMIPAVLKLKFRDAFRPAILHTKTFPLPDENALLEKFYGDLYTDYFDPVTISIPWLIHFQRGFYEFFGNTASGIYRILALLSLFAMFLSLYRKSFLKWASLALITATRILLPNFMSVANWRYSISGVPLLLIIGFNTLIILIFGASDLLIPKKRIKK